MTISSGGMPFGDNNLGVNKSFELKPVPGFNIPSREVLDFHNHDDVDSSTQAHHHTLGKGPLQAAPGLHWHYDLSKPWTNLILGNGWVPFDAGSPARTPQYARNAIGETIFRGLMKSGLSFGIFANVPVGFRPEPSVIYEHNFPVEANNAYAAIAVGSNGNMSFMIGSNVYVDLCNIRFKAVIV